MTDPTPSGSAANDGEGAAGGVSAVDERIARALGSLQRTNATLTSRRQSIEDELRSKHAQDQSDIARLIVWLFAISFCASGLLMTVAFVWRPDGWLELAEKLIAMLSSILLPIVTLVIGYYFGTEKRKKDAG